MGSSGEGRWGCGIQVWLRSRDSGGAGWHVGKRGRAERGGGVVGWWMKWAGLDDRAVRWRA